MTKRSSGQFVRNKGDYYRTWDPRTVAPLLPFLEPGTLFAEPCAGDFILAHHLTTAGHQLLFASDLEPKDRRVGVYDVMDLDEERMMIWTLQEAQRAREGTLRAWDRLVFITNPPWTRPILHAVIPHLARLRPTWLLFDADWAHTGQAAEFLPWCHLIVSAGRVKWIEGSRHFGKDNAAWYLFDYSRPAPFGGPLFINGGK